MRLSTLLPFEAMQYNILHEITLYVVGRGRGLLRFFNLAFS